MEKNLTHTDEDLYQWYSGDMKDRSSKELKARQMLGAP